VPSSNKRDNKGVPPVSEPGPSIESEKKQNIFQVYIVTIQRLCRESLLTMSAGMIG
jgi:hypothetical protein